MQVNQIQERIKSLKLAIQDYQDIAIEGELSEEEKELCKEIRWHTHEQIEDARRIIYELEEEIADLEDMITLAKLAEVLKKEEEDWK